MTPRCERLKEQILGVGEPPLQPPISGLARARLVTEAYRRTEGQPIVLRRAAALEAVLQGIPIAIHPDELIVGDRSCLSAPGYPPPAYPEFWGDRQPQVDEDEQAQADDIGAYWRERPELRAKGTLFGHTVPSFEKVLSVGFAGIAAQAQLGAFTGNPGMRNVRLAIAKVARAAASLGKRHADLARELAAGEMRVEAVPSTSLRTGREPPVTAYSRTPLQAIAERCSRVPAYPPRSFAEALQAVYFTQMVLQFEDPPNAQSLGRLDQYLWPFYRDDLKRGLLVGERQAGSPLGAPPTPVSPPDAQPAARELLACFSLKMWLPYDVQNAMIGGLRADGADSTNDLTYLILDTLEDVDLSRQTSLRWHGGTPPELLRRACAIAESKVIGQPQFFNDDVIVPSLVAHGVPLAEARDYSIIGCIEVTVGGRADPRVVAHYTNLAKCLELALNDGADLRSGRQLGPATGAIAELTTFEDLWRAYCAQVEHEVAQAAERLRTVEAEQVACYPLPALSALTDDCIQRGLDITAGGARYNSTGVSCVGIANVADSLAALREVVFEQRRAALPEVVEALRRDFEGFEGLRRQLLRAPKYGNDIESVDAVARDVVTYFCRTVEGHRDARGGDFRAHLLSFVLCVNYGRDTAATSDGRRAGEPLANSMAAQQGMAMSGPTALLRSAAKLEPGRAAAGTSLMVDLHPSALAGHEDGAALAALVEAYFRLGGGHLQFNVVDTETLRQAQAEPERYRGLMVRVAGYSAYFVTLDRALQEHIIARTAR